jgi:uncharacterized protein YndB with AHSA1/START domain
MSEVHEQALLDAPISTVWELVADPRRYTEWFPRVFEIHGERFEEGGRFVFRRWLVEAVDGLKRPANRATTVE